METKRILLADNHDDIRSIFRVIFEGEDFHLTIVSSANETLASVFSYPPHILVLDANLNNNATPDIIRTIRANNMTFNIPVLVVLSDDRPETKEAFNAVGDCNFISKPVSPARIKIEINDLLQERNLFGSRLKTKIVAFCGARGGSGTTTISVNTAIALQEEGKSVLLLELSNYFSGIKPALNIKTRRTVPYLMQEGEETLTPEKILEFIEEHETGIKAIPSIASVADMEKMSASTVRFMRHNLVPAAEICIVDSGYGLTDASLELIDISDQTVFVATCDMPSLYNLELINQVLEGARINRNKCALVFNHVHPQGEIAESAIRKLDLKLPILAFVPHHAAGFVKAMNEGKPYILEFPKTPSSKVLKTVAQAIVERAGISNNKPPEE